MAMSAPAFEGLQQLGRFFDRRREVGVAEEHDTALGVKHAVANTVSLAAIAGIFDEAQHGILRGHGAYDFRGVVARPVVDDDDFRIPAFLMDVGQHFLQRRAQAGALVVGRDDDAVNGAQ